MKFNRKKLTKKVKMMVKGDVMGSLAMASILLNVFFLSGILLFAATNQLDASLYNASVKNLCVDNYEQNLSKQLSENQDKDPETTKAMFEVVCVKGEFETYYKNAVDAYLKTGNR
jgi:hypothetical protein